MKKALLFGFLLSMALPVFSQEETDPDEPPVRKSKVLAGLYVGSYLANRHSASTYSGYGYDFDGNQNTFFNSLMYQKIKNEYGGGYGQYDYIADAIGVDQRQWEFNESDMPTNMRYSNAIMVGLNVKIPLSPKTSILFNMRGSKINVEGNFTLTTLKPTNPNPLVTSNVVVCAIRGTEQRLLFELGFQQLFGGDEKFNFLIEGGLIGTLAKYDRNMIYIKNLQIDLTYYVNQTLYPQPYPSRAPIGFGIGAFAGLGLNLDISPKFNIQLLYNPSYEKVNIGINPEHKLNHGIGLRAYYKI